jgi:hypothetical protein
MKVFRPQNLSKTIFFYNRNIYNWNNTFSINRYKESNKQTISKIFSNLHYLACHAPKKVNKKWLIIYNKFMNKHCANKKYNKWSNKYTCNRWL